MKAPSRATVAVWLVASAWLGGAGFGCQPTCEEQLDCGPYEPELDAGLAGSAGGRPSAGAGGAAFGGSGIGGSLGTSGAPGSAESSAGEQSGGSSGGDGEGGNSGSGNAGEGGAGDGCDVSSSPRLERCLVDERFAVFVSPDGDDDAAGTRAAPVHSLDRAQAIARAGGRRVIACAGVYDGPFTIAAEGAATIHGGFDCENDWQPIDEKSVVAPESGVALRVEGAKGPVLVEDFELRSADAAAPGESSIAVFVSDSVGVTLRRTRIEAGRGASGEAGETVGFEFPEEAALQGGDGSELQGGAGEPCECPGGAASGRGAGGGPLENGEAGSPDHGGPGGEPGNAAASCGAGGTGLDGASGPNAHAASGAVELGELTALGWRPAAGEAALAGAPGQGGGGGAGKASGGGGAGGCGGCGGQGGPGGGGGGASIALLSVDSRVLLEVAEIVTDDGGDGGDGGVGQVGQGVVGGGGIGYGSGALRGCVGGNGGVGGDGGSGGGGAGGVSVGVVFRGEEPTRDRVTFALGAPGSGGLGNVVATTTDDGVEGVKADTLEIQ